MRTCIRPFDFQNISEGYFTFLMWFRLSLAHSFVSLFVLSQYISIRVFRYYCYLSFVLSLFLFFFLLSAPLTRSLTLCLSLSQSQFSLFSHSIGFFWSCFVSMQVFFRQSFAPLKLFFFNLTFNIYISIVVHLSFKVRIQVEE